MSFEFQLIAPDAISRPDVIGLYAMPIDANMGNTGDRLKATADIVGFPLIASDLFMQHRKMIFDMKARTANQPSGDTWQTMNLRRWDAFGSYLQDVGYNQHASIGIGDSLGVAAVQGMAIVAQEEQKAPGFNALLLRDGWNLKPAGIVRSIGRYVGYTARDIAQQQRHPAPKPPKSPYSAIRPDLPNQTNIVEKIINVSDMMRGPENYQHATYLAGKTDIPIHVVGLRNGLSGSETSMLDFMGQLVFLRQTRTDTQMSTEDEVNFFEDDRSEPHKPTLATTIRDGWHSSLLSHDLLAEDIKTTLKIV